MDRDTVAVVLQAKSVAMAILLTLFFGGLGVFYVSIPGGIIMSILTVIVWIISFVTFGIGGIFLIPLIHGISIIWGIVGVNNHNKKLTSTYMKEDAGTVQAAAPSVPTEPQISPRSERPVQEPTSDPQVAAKHQAYKIRIAKDPGNVALIGEYGDFLARLGNVDEALIQYFTIVELQPEDTSTRRKIAELYKSQNNIPNAATQLRHILEIRHDDIEVKEELDRLYNSSDNKSPSSPTPGEGEIPRPETLQESGKAEGNKKTGLLAFAIIVSVALIAAAIFLIKQRQLASFLQPPPTQEGRNGILPLPSPVPTQSMTSEASQKIQMEQQQQAQVEQQTQQQMQMEQQQQAQMEQQRQNEQVQAGIQKTGKVDAKNYIKVINATVRGVAFMESGPEETINVFDQGRYQTSFSKNNTRRINCILLLNHPAPMRRIDYQFTCVWHDLSNNITNNYNYNTYMESNWIDSSPSLWFGNDTPGNFNVGNHKVDFYVQGDYVTSGYFTVY